MQNDPPTPIKMLVIDEEPQIRRLLKHSLEGEGYDVRTAEEGVAGLNDAAFTRPDVVILDLSLPDISGLEVIRRLREWTGIPILVLTVRASQPDKILALDTGANDYLTKPFDPSELFARLRVLTRRPRASADTALVSFGTVRVDLNGHIVTKDGREIPLTAREYALLSLLVKNPGKILSHKQILREIWGPRCENRTNYLRVYMGRLRQKLEDSPNQPRFLRTACGFGYRLDTEAAPIN